MDLTGDLPSWWMGKVTLASDYLNKSRDYLLFPDMNESELNEEYIELMPNIEEALEQIIEDWIQWKSGPATEPGDIKPARKELLNFCMAYLKKNIK